MNTFIAHAGHPLATDNAVEHGLGHWFIIIPITVAIAAILLTIMWAVSKKPAPQEQEVEDKDK